MRARREVRDERDHHRPVLGRLHIPLEQHTVEVHRIDSQPGRDTARGAKGAELQADVVFAGRIDREHLALAGRAGRAIVRHDVDADLVGESCAM